MKRPGILFQLLCRHLLKKPFTVLYPHEPWELPEGYRGILEYDDALCIGCGKCANVCSAEAIRMVEDPEKRLMQMGKERRKKPVFFLDHCIRCAQCEESCPQHAVRLRKNVGLIAYVREAMSSGN